jgi:hypothetical protein
MPQTPESDPDAALRRIHGLLRDYEHFLKNLHTFEKYLEFLLKSYKAVLAPADRSEPLAQDPDSADKGINPYRGVDDSLQLLLGRARRYRCWASIQRNRTQNQINLVCHNPPLHEFLVLTDPRLFRLAMQFENQTNTRIAYLTAKVAQQTLRDSSSMITIAVLTVFFLPGTLISVRAFPSVIL